MINVIVYRKFWNYLQPETDSIQIEKNSSKQMIKLLISIIQIQASLQSEIKTVTQEGLTRDKQLLNPKVGELIPKETSLHTKEIVKIDKLDHKSDNKSLPTTEEIERHHSVDSSNLKSRNSHHRRHYKKTRRHRSHRKQTVDDDSFLRDYNLLTDPTFATVPHSNRGREFDKYIRSDQTRKIYAIKKLLQNELFDVPYNILDIVGKRILERQIEDKRFKNVITITKHIYPVDNKKITEYLINERIEPKEKKSVGIFSTRSIIAFCLLIFLIYILIVRRILSKQITTPYTVVKEKS